MSLLRLAKESLVYGLSRYIAKFIAIFLLPLYTAVLSPEDYGILDLLGTIALVSTFLIISGTDTAVGYYFFRKENYEERPVIITSSLFLRLVFSIAAFIIILIASSTLSNILFGKDYSLFVTITGMTILFSSLHSFLFDLLRLEFRAWMFTFLSTFSVVMNILLTVLFVLVYKQGVFGALKAQAIAYGIIFAFTIFYVIKRYGFKISGKWINKILKYGFPLIGTGVAIWVLNSTDRYFLAHYVDLSTVGIYAVGMKLASFLGMIGGALQLAWGPYALDIQYQDDAKKIYSKVFLIFFIVNIIGIFLVSIFSIDILKVFTQPSYYSAKAVVPFLCTSVVFSGAYFVISIGINITKKLLHTIWITISAAFINIALNFILTPIYGVLGAAFSIMASNFLILWLTFRISQKYYFVPYNYTGILILGIIAGSIIAVSYYFDLTLFYRIILSFLYITFTAIFVHRNFKDTGDFKKLLKKLSNIRQKKAAEPNPADINL